MSGNLRLLFGAMERNILLAHLIDEDGNCEYDMSDSYFNRHGRAYLSQRDLQYLRDGSITGGYPYSATDLYAYLADLDEPDDGAAYGSFDNTEDLEVNLGFSCTP